MKQSIRQKLDLLTDRLDEIDRMLSAPETAGDMEQFRKLSRERAEVEPVIVQYNAFRQAEKDIEEASAMLADPDMREFAEEEMAAAKLRLPELEIELQKLLLPKDPNDERSVLLEVRVGKIGSGQEIVLRAADGMLVGTVSPHGIRPGNAAGTYVVPVPPETLAHGLRDGRLRLYILIERAGAAARPVRADEVLGVRAVVVD
jgi:hypothetical protein